MNLLNLGCGGDRPQTEDWINMDCLHSFLKPGTPERTNLDRESNYIDFDLVANLGQSLPIPRGAYDGILCQHVLEHFDLHHSVQVVKMARAALTPDGWFVASVPNATYFMDNLHRDTRENAVEIFGEPISEPQYERFFDYALFHREHKQLFTHDCLMAILVAGGFKRPLIGRKAVPYTVEPALQAIVPRLNRLPFSLVMLARNVL